MYIINTIDNATVAHITTNHSMTLDEAIALVGEYSNDRAAAGEPEVNIGGEWYFYDDLDMSWTEGRVTHIRSISDTAAALYDGGWRAEDRDEMKSEYELTDDEADAICKELESLAEDEEEV